MDGWPLAIIIDEAFGGQPKPVTVLWGVTGRWYPPLEKRMLPARSGLEARASLGGGPLLGKSSGGNWTA